jgi:hypothetical protein
VHLFSDVFLRVFGALLLADFRIFFDAGVDAVKMLAPLCLVVQGGFDLGVFFAARRAVRKRGEVR